MKNTDLIKEGLSLLPKDNWLYKYLQYTDTMESPSCFHIWLGLATISSVLERKVRISRGNRSIYANQFIILVAESAICRKSTAIDCAVDMFLKPANKTYIIQGKVTPEKLLAEIDFSRRNMLDSSVCFFAPELATLLGKNASVSKLTPILTNLYDCPKSAEYKTKAKGENLIQNACLNLIGTTTFDWVSTNIGKESSEDGFTGRALFIVGKKSRLSNAWPSTSESDDALRVDMLEHLAEIYQLNGEVKPTEEAKNFYSSWYAGREDNIKNKHLAGYYGRKETHILKVALAIECGNRNLNKVNLELSVDSIEIALKLLNLIEDNMIGEYGSLGKTSQVKNLDRILNQLKKLKDNHKLPIAHSKLLKSNSAYVLAKEFRIIIDILIKQGDIKKDTKSKKPKGFYDLI